MKRIHLTKDEKTLIRQFSRNNADCPQGMSQAEFVYNTIQLCNPVQWNLIVNIVLIILLVISIVTSLIRLLGMR